MRDSRPWDETVQTDERAVSEILGHILVFSIVVASIGLIIVTGFAGLEDTRDAERFQTADRAFDVLADNMAAIFERNNPSRATEIDVGDGQIGYDDRVWFNVTVDPDGEEAIHSNYSFRPLEFDVGSDRSIVYESGSVIRDQPRGGFVVRDAPLILSEERVHIPIVQTRPAAERSMGGTTVLVRAASSDRAILVDPSDAAGSGFDDLQIEITSPRAEQWATKLDSRSNVDCDDGTDGTVTCALEEVPTKTYVTLHRIQVSLES